MRVKFAANAEQGVHVIKLKTPGCLPLFVEKGIVTKNRQKGDVARFAEKVLKSTNSILHLEDKGGGRCQVKTFRFLIFQNGIAN